jgi:prepilin-type N-terminal cleavage/methylation domain-containing protein
MRHLVRFSRRPGGFTLIELLTVMTIIAILAALVLSISGYAQKKAALARAQGEIQAISAACESYKTDNGTYPYMALAVSGTSQPVTGAYTASSNVPSDQLDPRTNGNSVYTSGSTGYGPASLELYEALSGDLSCSGTGGGPTVKNYITDLRQDVLGRSNMNAVVSSSNQVEYLSDPFGNCYGYSTANASSVTSGTSCISGYAAGSYPGYNPTFDLWSTGGNLNTPANPPGSTGDPALSWVKNW